MTAPAWTAWAKEVWPGLTDADVSTLLWQCTNYPLGTIDEVEREFLALRDRAGGDVVRALEMVAERAENVREGYELSQGDDFWRQWK